MQLLRKFAVVVLAVLTLACGGVSRAQAPAPAQQPAEKPRRLNRAPVSKEILRVKLPRPYKTVLENGLTVLILEDHRFPLVTVQMTLQGAGAVHEPADLPGLASVSAQMLSEGTRNRTSRQIAEEVDNLGASVSASAQFGSSSTVLNASGLSDNFDQWLALAADQLLNPTFPAEELEKLKERLRAQLRQQRANSSFLVSERFNRAVYGRHPAAVRSATLESVAAITPERLAQWHAERYAPQNAILGIAGDVTAPEAVALLRKLLAGWKKTALKESLPPNPDPAMARKVYLVDRPGSVQTDVAIGNIAIDRRSLDYVPMVVMDQVLGASYTSRLFRVLREEKGYTYGAYSGYTAVKWRGPWQASGQIRTEVTDEALAEFLNQIRLIREEQVPAGELEENKRSVVARFALSLEEPDTLLNYATIVEIYGFPADYWDTYPAKILGVTADEVQRVAQKYLNPNALQIVAVGDAGKVRPVLEKYGPVELYDADGKPASLKPAAGTAP